MTGEIEAGDGEHPFHRLLLVIEEVIAVFRQRHPVFVDGLCVVFG